MNKTIHIREAVTPEEVERFWRCRFYMLHTGKNGAWIGNRCSVPGICRPAAFSQLWLAVVPVSV